MTNRKVTGSVYNALPDRSVKFPFDSSRLDRELHVEIASQVLTGPILSLHNECVRLEAPPSR